MMLSSIASATLLRIPRERHWPSFLRDGGTCDRCRRTRSRASQQDPQKGFLFCDGSSGTQRTASSQLGGCFMLLFSWFASALDRWLPARHGSARCACGAVQIQVRMPGSSYGIVGPVSVLCHCKDCVGFVAALGSSGDRVLANNASQVVHFYKSDVTVTHGSEHVRVVKLKPGTQSIRSYCHRCGTPLGAQFAGPIPFSGLYSQLLSGDELPVYLPRVVCNFDSALPRTRPYGGSAVVRRGMLAPWLIARSILRALLGFAFGKGGNGMLPPDHDEKAIPIGLESIEVAKSKNM